jgi:phage shock protein PspC (stress-responsive transcriptional regulator)
MMDKTITINIAGTLFRIDEDAFAILRDYLQAVNNRFRNMKGGAETVEDIESRIAEIFQSHKGLAGIITLKNVQDMISVIGKPGDFDQNDDEPEPQPQTTHRKRMYRNPDDTIISGVCGGIGAYLNTDPVLFRLLFVIFTIFFGVGFFVYLALWISLPPANSDARKREMYGDSYNAVMAAKRENNEKYASKLPSYNKGYYNTSRAGNALNEIFRAFGRVFYIILRILLIIVGVIFVITGFLFIAGFAMILIFKYPASISEAGFSLNLAYLSDFLKYVINPVLVPWITGLTLAILVLPMIALVYWGIKLIFWFRARDGVFSLAGFVLWILLIAGLAVIFFNEGISFADTGKTSTQEIFSHNPDTLYVMTGKKISGLKFDKELQFGPHGYDIMMNDETKEIYIRPFLNVYDSDSEPARVELRKRAAGRNETDALKKTEDLIYNFNLKRDTLVIDEYFTIPAGRKWSADNVGINIYLPEGTVIKLDRASCRLLHTRGWDGCYGSLNTEASQSGFRSFVITEEGLEPVSGHLPENK